mgnify:CR=1 FL=1
MKIAVSLTLLLALLFTEADAQITRPPVYDTCNYLRPLEGEWMSVSGTDTIKVYLRFHRNFYSDPETYNSTIDQLWGWIEYKQGPVVIMSDYANRFATLPYNLNDLTPGLRSIVLMAGKGGETIIPASYTGCPNPVTDLRGALRDIAKCRQKKNITVTVNGTGPGAQMIWELVQPPAVVNPGCEGLTLPEMFVLIKQ